MAERRVQEVVDELARRGLVADEGGDLRTTPAWRAALLKASEDLNGEARRSGANPAPGEKPLAVAVARAMKGLGLAELPKATRDEFHYVLLMLELARMTPSQRATQGFSEVTF